MKLSLFSRRRPSPADLAPVTVQPVAECKPPAPDRAALTPPPLPASARFGPVFAPGRYVVQYSRIGRLGDRRTGLPAPMPLTVFADSAADLAEQIRTDVAPYVGGEQRIEITPDMVVSGGTIRAGSITGTFTFARGGAR